MKETRFFYSARALYSSSAQPQQSTKSMRQGFAFEDTFFYVSPPSTFLFIFTAQIEHLKIHHSFCCRTGGRALVCVWGGGQKIG